MADDFTSSPGQDLKKVLYEIFPPDGSGQKSFSNRVDIAFGEDGKLSSIMYESTINYITRRLIFTANFLKRRLELNGKIASEEEIRKELKHYVRNHVNITNSSYAEKVVTFLRECIRIREKKIPDSIRSNIKRKAKKSKDDCYICGKTIDYNASQNKEDKIKNDFQHDLPEVEHLWPNSLGGIHHPSNLKISCAKCNREKADNIDASDFHYEHVCLMSTEEDESFTNELDIYKKLAIWAKSNFSCIQCGRSAAESGELTLVRNDEDDSWHFSNIDAFCSNCFQKIPERRSKKSRFSK